MRWLRCSPYFIGDDERNKLAVGVAGVPRGALPLVPKADGDRAEIDSGHGAGADPVVDSAGVCNLGIGRRYFRRLSRRPRGEPRSDRSSSAVILSDGVATYISSQR
jgi:hypothetical protein